MKTTNINLVDAILWFFGAFGPAIATGIYAWFARRLKSNHVIGLLAIAIGEVGLGLTVAVMYVWCAIVIPANVAIATRLPLPNALYLYSGLGVAAVIFSLVGALSILSNLFGICKFAPYSSSANLIRKYIFRRPMKRRISGATVV